MKRQAHFLTLAITCLFSLTALSQTQSDPLGPEQGVTPTPPRKAPAAPLDEKIKQQDGGAAAGQQQQAAPREKGGIIVNDEASAIKIISPKPESPVDESLRPENQKAPAATTEPVKVLRIRKKDD